MTQSSDLHPQASANVYSLVFLASPAIVNFQANNSVKVQMSTHYTTLMNKLCRKITTQSCAISGLVW